MAHDFDIATLRITAEERRVLQRDLDEFVDAMREIYESHTGTDWDECGAYNRGGIHLLVRARDDLVPVDGPWVAEGARDDLPTLLTRLRAGSIKGLEMGAGRPEWWMTDLDVARPESRIRV
jgi:hypothetical protein